MESWYLIQTKRAKEKIAIENLENQNFKTYFPYVLIKNKITALFPRYVFVKPTNEKQDVHPIKSTKGVLNIVRFGTELAKVNNNIIESLKHKEEETKEKIINMQSLHKGDKVEITDGIFKDYKAIFTEASDENRVILLLKLINREHKIILDNSQIRKF